MCIAYLSLGHPAWPVLVAANRDEFHARPAAAAAPWPGHEQLIAGRDLTAGGTWLGCAAGGRFALLTNYREPGVPVPAHAPSRGLLVRDYLLGGQSAAHYIDGVARHAQDWAGFNLIVADAQGVWYLGNRDPRHAPRQLGPGQYVLSNHLLDTPWPKARRLRAALQALPAPDWTQYPERVFALLRDTTQAPADELPDTGLGPVREQLLSSPFIVSPEYGTRCSTLITGDAAGGLSLSELSYDAEGAPTERHDWHLSAQPAQP